MHTILAALPTLGLSVERVAALKAICVAAIGAANRVMPNPANRGADSDRWWRAVFTADNFKKVRQLPHWAYTSPSGTSGSLNGSFASSGTISDM
jgi:hypothetical protein